jgi:hypothetical protein
MPPKLVTRLNRYKMLQCTKCHWTPPDEFNSVEEVKRRFAGHLEDSYECQRARAECMFVRGGAVRWS